MTDVRRIFHAFADNILRNVAMPISFKIYWVLHNITLDLTFLITTVFWAIVYKSVKGKMFHSGFMVDKVGATVSYGEIEVFVDLVKLDAAMILIHISNSVIMFLDVDVVLHPSRM